MRRFVSAALALCISVTSFSAKEVMAGTIDGETFIEEIADEADYCPDSDNSEELEVLDNSEDNDISENALEGSSEYDSSIEDASEEISIETEEGASENSSTDDAEDIAFEEYDSIGGEYEVVRVDLSKEVINFGGLPKDSSYSTFAQDYSDLYEVLSKAIGSYTRIVDLKDYDLSTAEAQERIIDYLNQDVYSFVVKEVIVLKDTNSDKALAYEIEYAEDSMSKAKKLAKAIDDITSGVEDNWSDYAKVIYLANKLCEINEYDRTLTHHTAYDALVLHTSVCQGYMEAFFILANKVGVKTDRVISKKINHGWNVSYIDGYAYFTDCTWADDEDSPDDAYIVNRRLSIASGTGLGRIMNSRETDMKVHGITEDEYDESVRNYPTSSRYEFYNGDYPSVMVKKITDDAIIYMGYSSGQSSNLMKLDLNTLERTLIYSFDSYNTGDVDYDGKNFYFVKEYSKFLAHNNYKGYYEIVQLSEDSKTKESLYTLETEYGNGNWKYRIQRILRIGDGLDYYVYTTGESWEDVYIDHIGHIKLDDTSSVYPRKIELISDEYAFTKIGESTNIFRSISEGSAKDIKWTSSNPDVVSVSDGVISCLNYGVATISAEAGDVRVTCRAYLDTDWQEMFDYSVSYYAYLDVYPYLEIKNNIRAEGAVTIPVNAVAGGVECPVSYLSIKNDSKISGIKFEEGSIYKSLVFYKCNSLKAIDFEGIYDAGFNSLIAISECPKLEYISYRGAELASKDNIWMAGVFKDCPNLKILDFSGVQFKGVVYPTSCLKSATKLETIYTPASVNPKVSMPIPAMYEYKNGVVGSVTYTDLMKAPTNSVLISKAMAEVIDISGATIYLERDTFIYDGYEKKPEVVVFYNNKKLKQGTDFTVSYSDNVNIGIASVVINGIKKFKGTKTATFSIVEEYGDAKATSPSANIPSGQVEYKTPIILSTATPGADIYYTLDGSDPTADSGYYSNPIIVDKENLVIKAIATKESMKDSDVVTFTYTATQDWGDITSPAIRAQFGDDIAKVPEGLWYIFGNEKEGYGSYIRYGNYTKSSVASFVYTGTRISFNDKISVYHGNKKLCENRDYSLKYSNNTNAGNGSGSKAPKVTITGKGNYKSTCSFYFSINAADINTAVMTTDPEVVINAGTKLSTVKPALTFNGKKLSVGKDYQLFYYRNSVDDKNRINNGNETVQSGTKYYVVVKGAAEVSGSKSVNFGNTYDTIVTVEAVDPKNKTVVKASSLKVTVPKQVYTGNVTDAVKLFDNSDGKISDVVIKNGKNTLIYGEDFTVSLSKSTDHVSSGKHTLILTGTNNAEKETKYVGSKAVSYEITGTKMSGVKVAGLNTAVEYSGNEFTLNELFKADSVTQSNGYKAVTLYTTVKSGSTKTCKALTEGTDYTVKMDNNGSTGSFNIAFIGMGAYSGTLNKKITVKAYNLKTDSRKAISITASDAVYSKAGAVPTVTVKCNGKVLKEGLDYKLSFKNNKAVSGAKKPTVVVTGMGNYTGANSGTSFNISKADIKSAVTLVSVDKPYKAAASAGYFKSVPKLMDNGVALSIGKGKDVEPVNSADYHYYFADTHLEIGSKAVISAGTLIEVRVKVTCSEKSPYKEGSYELIGYYQILDNGLDISKAIVTIKDASKLSYNNGKYVVPLKERDLIVTIGKTTLSSDDYEIVSVTNNKFVGRATITIRGKGIYGGSKKAVFKIGAKPIDEISLIKSS